MTARQLVRLVQFAAFLAVVWEPVSYLASFCSRFAFAAMLAGQE